MTTTEVENKVQVGKKASLQAGLLSRINRNRMTWTRNNSIRDLSARKPVMPFR
jgi:hypothetical protein